MRRLVVGQSGRSWFLCVALCLALAVAAGCESSSGGGAGDVVSGDDTGGGGGAGEQLCQQTGGSWSADACLCGEGKRWDATDGCVPHGGDLRQALCEQTGGIWSDAGCECTESESWNDTEGCIPDGLNACLLECGDGCFQPEHKVCGDDGEWWCPCEMACHGVEQAAQREDCCEPLAPGCVPHCEENVAYNCTVGQDEYGCPQNQFEQQDCGAGTCAVGAVGSEARCVADAQELCETTAGAWVDGACDCGPGGAWDDERGCWNHDEGLCLETRGAWAAADCGPFCGTCECGEGARFDDEEGCVADDLEACLLACGDGCFQPEHKVCGADGQWWCPCEMACHGVEQADYREFCCVPVPSNCLPTCEDNVAMNCDMGQDEYGCYDPSWTYEDCGAGTCVADYEADLAYCAGGDVEALCRETEGQWSDDTCDCGPGGAWDDERGCWNREETLCVESGGAWQPAYCGPYCGDCDCGDDARWDAQTGCVPDGPEPCAPWDAELGQGMCDTAFGYKWNGEACEYLGGACECLGADCDRLFMDLSECEAAFAHCDGGGDDEALCRESGGQWVDGMTGGACDCGPGGEFDAERGCFARDEGLCDTTHGSWMEADCGPFCGSCDCGPGGAWDDERGCWNHDETLCLGSGGAWEPAYCGPYCGVCDCGDTATWHAETGCIPEGQEPCTAWNAELGEGMCDTAFGYKWNGEECEYLGGACECVGVDCERLFMDLSECEAAFAHCDGGSDPEETLCRETGGEWVDGMTGGACDCGPGGGFEAERGCFARDQELCRATQGSWMEADCGPFCGSCDCGAGGAWDDEQGCWNRDETLCVESGGSWQPAWCGPYCGECDCPDGQAWDAEEGCVADDLAACLEACGVGCFLPEHKVCGADGQWWCACEMACHGVVEAEYREFCCDPVPPMCVSWCDGNTAMNCTMSEDEYGCPFPDASAEPCGENVCVEDYTLDLAYCRDACAPMDAELGGGMCDTFLGYAWNGESCDYLGGACECIGVDCGWLFPSEEDCLAAFSECRP